MLYGILTVLAKVTAQNTYDYKMPIIARQDFYNRIENIDTVTHVLLKEGRTEGYDSIDLFFQEVCTFLGFNPFKIKEIDINTRGLNTMEVDVINAFMGEYKENNDNHSNFYPKVDDNANLMGYTYLAEGYSPAQATIAQTFYGQATHTLFQFTIREKTFDTNSGVQTVFEVWPEESIKHKYIDTQHFFTDNDNLIKTGFVEFNIWLDESTNKYNYSIYITAYYYNQAETNYINNKLNGAELDHVYNPDNPLDNTQKDGDEGGNGDYNNDDDQVDVPDLPSLDITAAGGLNLYKLAAADFAALMTYLGSNAPGDSIVKWFTNPIQAIMACYMLPYPVTVNGSGEITVVGAHTGVTAYKAGQWTRWNLGSVYIPQGFGDCFLDYSPWSRVSLFLPFIGVKQLNADDVIQKTIGIEYHFDNISGACAAYITSNGNLRYTFTGSCAVGIPISQSNWGQTYLAAATAAAGAIAGGVGAVGGAIAEGASLAETIGSGVIGAVQGGGGLSAFNSKPTVTRSGAVCGAGAAIGLNKPVLFIERPDKAKIEDPKNVIGITSGRTLSLGSLSGFNSIEHVHLHGIAATASELDEIEKLLYEGVIF